MTRSPLASPFFGLIMGACATVMAGGFAISVYALKAESDANKARHAAQADVLERSTMVQCGGYTVVVIASSVRTVETADKAAGDVCAWREYSESPSDIATALAY